MSLPQHKDPRIRFDQQVDNSAAYVLPFIEEKLNLTPSMKIMEVGCGEGGVLLPLLKKGYRCVGVELAAGRVRLGKEFLKEYVEQGTMTFITSDIYDIDFLGAFKDSFDLIILKDAIEHIPHQEKIMGYLRQLLTPDGHIFFGFPPWYMPYGGHQQICRGKMSKALYIHLLPGFLYRGLLKLGGEEQKIIKELMEVKSTGISIERFERIVKRCRYQIVNKRFYLLNPIYRFKFGWKPKVQNAFVARIPFLRNFVTSCVYYLIKK